MFIELNLLTLYGWITLKIIWNFVCLARWSVKFVTISYNYIFIYKHSLNLNERFGQKNDNLDQEKGKVNSYLKDNEPWLLFKHDGNLPIVIYMSFFILHLIWFYKYSSSQWHFERNFLQSSFWCEQIATSCKKHHILYIVSSPSIFHIIYRYIVLFFVCYVLLLIVSMSNIPLTSFN